MAIRLLMVIAATSIAILAPFVDADAAATEIKVLQITGALFLG